MLFPKLPFQTFAAAFFSRLLRYIISSARRTASSADSSSGLKNAYPTETSGILLSLYESISYNLSAVFNAFFCNYIILWFKNQMLYFPYICSCFSLSGIILFWFIFLRFFIDNLDLCVIMWIVLEVVAYVCRRKAKCN